MHVSFEVAGSRAGHSGLIHAAAGGVGLNATEYAMWLRMRALGTLGSLAKHRHLRLAGHGEACTASSRDATAFTHGLGSTLSSGRLECVLNSLSNDFTAVSFASLAEGGCFAEIGKRGIWSREYAPRPVPTVRYEPVAVDVDMVEKPMWMQGMLVQTAARAAQSVVRGLPRAIFDFGSIIKLALQLLRKGKNIGKVVVRVFEERWQPLQSASASASSTDVVSGGGGGLGLITARWLAERSREKHVLLVSRSGALSIAAMRALREGRQRSTGRCDGAGD